MPDLSETITLLDASFQVIIEGQYDLTADAMRIRNQRPLYSGDDYEFAFTLVDTDGDPVSITGATIEFTAKFKPGDADPGIVQVTGVVTDGPNGEFTIMLANTDVPGPYAKLAFYEVQMTVGSNIRTILHGNIEFLSQLTDA